MTTDACSSVNKSWNDHGRKHHPDASKFNCLWHDEKTRFSGYDTPLTKRTVARGPFRHPILAEAVKIGSITTREAKNHFTYSIEKSGGNYNAFVKLLYRSLFPQSPNFFSYFAVVSIRALSFSSEMWIMSPQVSWLFLRSISAASFPATTISLRSSK